MEELSLRDKLYLPKKLTFGVEIEAKGKLSRLSKYKSIIGTLNPKKYDYKNWYLKMDTSLVNSKNRLNGRELSSPVFTDEIETWKSIKAVCELIKDFGGYIDGNCALHVHLGAHYLNNNPLYLLNFMLLCSIYEPVFYSMNSYENPIPRTNVLTYARPIAYQVQHLSILDDLNDLTYLKIIGEIFDRCLSVNFLNLINLNPVASKYTIEGRSFNGTLDPVCIQNIVNFFAHILIKSTDNIDTENLIYTLKQMDIPRDDTAILKKYMKTNEELFYKCADEIFTDELDKKYFLKQTLKR